MAQDNVVPIGPPHSIIVSHEMTIVRGRGALKPSAVPTQAMAVAFDMSDASPSLTVVGQAGVEALLDRTDAGRRVVLLLAPEVVDRIDGCVRPDEQTNDIYYLPCELRAIALAVRDCTRRGEAAEIYLAAKSIELIYETWEALDRGALTPMAASGDLSQADSVRIAAAQTLIEARWHEKLSLDLVAAECGLNREKLTRGFRLMFSCSVSEALAERRLTQASRMLLTTDLPVSSVGYENGYINNASFARAFGRRFGISPSDYRARHLAA